MPDFPIIDSHVHFYDPAVISYPWLASVPPIDGRFLPRDYDAARSGVEVERIVFVEVDAAPEQAHEETVFAAGLAERDKRIGSIVAAARLDRDAADQLDRLAAIPGVRGIRHLIQQYPENDWCLQPRFVDGVRSLERYGFSFDICIKHRQLGSATELVRLCPNVQFVLDHVGKPGIQDGLWQPWADELRTMAALPNVVCKIAGVVTEADHVSWNADQLRPYVGHALDCFGYSRVMFGSDWPVVNLAANFQRWVGVLDDILAGSSEAEVRQFYRDNALRIYRMEK